MMQVDKGMQQEKRPHLDLQGDEVEFDRTLFGDILCCLRPGIEEGVQVVENNTSMHPVCIVF